MTVGEGATTAGKSRTGVGRLVLEQWSQRANNASAASKDPDNFGPPKVYETFAPWSPPDIITIGKNFGTQLNRSSVKMRTRTKAS